MILVSLCNIVITVTFCLQVPHPPWLQQTHVRQSKGHFECTWSSASVADAEHSKWGRGGGHTMAFQACLSREVLGAWKILKFRHSESTSGDFWDKHLTYHFLWVCYTATVSLHGSMHTMRMRILKNVSAQRSDYSDIRPSSAAAVWSRQYS